MIDTSEEQEHSEYLSIQEAAAFLGVSRASLDNYARAGRIHRYELGAPVRTRYKRSELNLLKRVRRKYQ
jgi:predicted site-specific integrase-resolvase